MALRLSTALCAVLAVIGWADVERPSLRMITGRDMVRVVVIVQPHSDHRALYVSGAIFRTDEDGEPVATWERSSAVQLDGDQAPASHTFEWNLPRSREATVRTLTVQAAVVCATAQGQAFIP